MPETLEYTELVERARATAAEYPAVEGVVEDLLALIADLTDDEEYEWGLLWANTRIVEPHRSQFAARRTRKQLVELQARSTTNPDTATVVRRRPAGEWEDANVNDRF